MHNLKQDLEPRGPAERPPDGARYIAGSHIRRPLLENIFSLYVLQGLNFIIPMVLLPFLVRVLGLEMYGLIAFTQSFAQYFTLLTDYGFNYSATRTVATHLGNASEISRTFSSVFLLKALFTLVGAVILLGVVESVHRFQQDRAFFLLAYLAVLGGALFPTWLFQGLEQMRYISIVIAFSRLVGTLLIFVFVRQPSDALLALGLQSGATLLGGILGLLIAFRKFQLRLVVPTRTDLQTAVSEGWHLFVSTAAVSLYTNTNVFLVGLLGGNVQAGYFSAAEKIVRAVQGVIGPISQAVFPRMNGLVAHSKHQALLFAAKTMRWVGSLSLAGSAIIFLFAPYIVRILFGNASSGSIPIIRWIAFLPALIAISNVLGVQIMVTFNLDREFSRILIIAGLFNILLGVPLIKLFFAAGAGAAVLFTECLVTVLMIWQLKRHKIHVWSWRRSIV